MFSPIKSHRRASSCDLRPINVPFFPKSPLTLMKRRRRVRFDNTIITHQLPSVEPQSAPWMSSKEFIERQVKECHLLRSKETAKTYLKECEIIKRKLRRYESTETASKEETTSTSKCNNCYTTTKNSDLETHISEALLEGLRLSNYRGLESGSYSERRARTPTIVKSVVDHYHQSKRRYSFLNKSKINDDLSTFAHQQTLPDQHWARVLALVDERIVER